MTKPKAKSPKASVLAVSVGWILIILIWTFVRIVAYICLSIAPTAPLAKAPLITIVLNVEKVARILWASLLAL